ncbi:MAG: hypothetical protein WCI77_08760 [Candidatus Omnitrophota bacterium]
MKKEIAFAVILVSIPFLAFAGSTANVRISCVIPERIELKRTAVSGPTESNNQTETKNNNDSEYTHANSEILREGNRIIIETVVVK